MHTHQLILIKEPSEGYRIYWCYECGIVCEFLSTGVAEMIPEWTKIRLYEENQKDNNYEFRYTFTNQNSDDFMYKGKNKDRRLGKSLKQMRSTAPRFLKELIKDDNNGQS